MRPEAHATDLLRVRAAVLEEIRFEFEKQFKTAPKTNPETRFLSAEQEFATRLQDMQRDALVRIRTIEAGRKG